MHHAFAETRLYDGPGRTDRLIRWLADRQHGVVTLWQLLDLGITRDQIEFRLRRRRLVRLHEGVYAVGHRVLTREGRWIAAVFAGRDRAALSYFSAASLELLRRGTGPRSHVTVPRRRRSTDRIAFHYADLPADEVICVSGIPVTSPARTMLDLAALLPSHSVARMLETAENLRNWEGPPLAELISRYPRRAGVPLLRQLLAAPLARTRSDLEASFIDFLDAASLPRPATNQVIEGYEVDFVWRERRVIVELDAFATHGSTFAFERDRERDRRLQAAGWTVVRVTDRQMTARTASELRRLLS